MGKVRRSIRRKSIFFAHLFLFPPCVPYPHFPSSSLPIIPTSHHPCISTHKNENSQTLKVPQKSSQTVSDPYRNNTEPAYPKKSRGS
ncbi:hypothetical protein P153DRAFT_367403 [Dothidotthia symphoricarpi CBS 119687]|uniref:Uncharacterized protein n=1 Tax=Dothidotthia symphoricarpi CBS 119687 TaxID=1392245 RepID=A0A6A6ABD2_9PLEO|nr:uncharacterized protein P153DRAFT_367403 [Dothidotthia symphoricarpi CBS 119687]KAF2129130.1 hypothetical protein P153DRAFT_367403 [Dothidotthia symphoricarpi CBS 119687]